MIVSAQDPVALVLLIPPVIVIAGLLWLWVRLGRGKPDA